MVTPLTLGLSRVDHRIFGVFGVRNFKMGGQIRFLLHVWTTLIKLCHPFYYRKTQCNKTDADQAIRISLHFVKQIIGIFYEFLYSAVGFEWNLTEVT